MFISFKKIKRNRGMTYVELIVVLSIFATMSSIVLFNYGTFQGKVDIKNLASDIALKIVQAQKSALSGQLPPLAQQTIIASPSTWKPAYGVYFNKISNNKNFFYFTDVTQNGTFESPSCIGVTECLENITMAKDNKISSLDVFYQGDSTPHSLNDLTILFTRPNSSPTFQSTSSLFGGVINFVQITISSSQNINSLIKIYLSGRIDIK